MITKTTRRAPVQSARTPVTAGTSITSGVRSRNAAPISASFNKLTPSQKAFARQLQSNVRRAPIMAATNTTNIMARPDFLELLPMFVQKLLVLDVFGSVAMKSRQQLIPYFKFIAENTKGVTKAGDVLSSPFVNRQGMDENFTGRVVKNEEVASVTSGTESVRYLAYTPILPNTVTIEVDGKAYVDDGMGNLVPTSGAGASGSINYSDGRVNIEGTEVLATYQYDNENVGPRTPNGIGYEYGAQMAKGYLQLDEINLIAEAHELACYWSIFSAFAAQQEYGSNVGDIAKEAAFSEITAEINAKGFNVLRQAASYNPQFNWDASPVLSGSVVPSDYLNMLKLKLNQASAAVYQATHLSNPNRLICGTDAAAYFGMINGIQTEESGDNVGPYKLGRLDKFEIYVNPEYPTNEWVMCCKSNDIRRNSALFGEYMPLTDTAPIGLANSSVQQGYATMYGMKVVNPATVVSGKILGIY